MPSDLSSLHGVGGAETVRLLEGIGLCSDLSTETWLNVLGEIIGREVSSHRQLEEQWPDFSQLGGRCMVIFFWSFPRSPSLPFSRVSFTVVMKSRALPARRMSSRTGRWKAGGRRACMRITPHPSSSWVYTLGDFNETAGLLVEENYYHYCL